MSCHHMSSNSYIPVCVRGGNTWNIGWNNFTLFKYHFSCMIVTLWRLCDPSGLLYFNPGFSLHFSTLPLGSSKLPSELLYLFIKLTQIVFDGYIHFVFGGDSYPQLIGAILLKWITSYLVKLWTTFGLSTLSACLFR